ncbi:hypothetical protein Hs30E_20090 [Lactococcus hodotermopsidis]|uniref:PepSY domain-containing protein n=1 Tax=Pseudolactococcus hodotermopsidis TaxID=2709157 RepID=A0A6A0BGH4_9LACT|nr:hypothetical protein Hs30E_20090 [Lactococcus hodotermopsidis]
MKIGVGVLVGLTAVTSARAIYQKRRDKNLRDLLTVAKQHFMYHDILTSWLMEEPLFESVHAGGIVRVDGSVTTFEIDAQTLKIVETLEV